MKLFKIAINKLILIIVLISILIMFFATPISNAELDLEEGDFYYSGTAEGSYKPKGGNIFSWFIESFADIADWILGIITLGPRMVFVGWTALLEKLLTWGVESASGVRVDGVIVSDPTDLTAITDSNNNITVEAIVYNKIAALDADIFETEFDRTLSATGHRLVCEKCQEYTDELGLKRYKAKYADECIPAATAEAILADPDSETEYSCSCACGGCDACQIYLAQLRAEDPIITRIKQLVATWYYVIRTLAMAAMLVVLLAIGIKMAISTIASDKAVYKRMLIDWVVGVILLFTLHYFMVFVISINDIMVGTVERFAQSVNQESLKQAEVELNMDSEDVELASKDLEIRVYEEIRTRAYDGKLTDGTMGMIMYMALVFMAIKFTVIYVKRLFTILILTLMAPGIGVAYALQKVFSGKSHALKTWMTEYIMNIIIQIVHALIYAIFISQALVLSLTNISGMILALVLMNYTSKAEEVFKKIFKFGGKDSLLGHTENAMESLNENLQSTKALITGAKPAAKILTNTPYAKALKGIGKMAVAGAVVGTSKVGSKISKLTGGQEGRENRQYQKQWDKEYAQVEAEHASYATRSDRDAEIEQMQREATDRLRARGILSRTEKDKLLGKPKADHQANLDEANAALVTARENLEKDPNNKNLQKTYKEAEEKQAAAQDNMNNYEELTKITTKDIVKGHAEKIFDIENTFKLTKAKGPTDWKAHQQNFNTISDAVFGTLYFDPKKMKYVRQNDGIYTRFSAENALGLTKEDKKVLKEQIIAPIVTSAGGVVSLFTGMGTFVTNPKVGLPLLAGGIATTHKTLHRKPNNDKYKNRKYKYARLSAGAINTIKENATEIVEKEARQKTAQNLKGNRKGFVENFKSGNVKAVTLGTTLDAAHQLSTQTGSSARNVSATKQSATQIAEWIKADNENGSTNMFKEPTLGYADRARNVGSYVGGKFFRSFGILDNLAEVEKHVLNQRKKLEDGIKEDAVKLMETQTKAEMQHLINIEFEKLTAIDEKIAEDEGFELDPKTKIMTRKEVVEVKDIKESDKHHSKPSHKDVNKALDEVLQNHSKSDVTSKSTQNAIIKEFTKKLRERKLIKAEEQAEDIFKGGEAAIVKAIKGKSARMKDIEEVTTPLKKVLTEDQIKTVQEMTRDASRGESVNAVLARISGINSSSNSNSGNNGGASNNRPGFGNGTTKQNANQPTNDGTKRVNPSESASRVDTSKTGDRAVPFGNSPQSNTRSSSGDGSGRVILSESGSIVDSNKTGDFAVLLSDQIARDAVEKYVSVMTSGPKTMRDSKKKIASALSMMLPEDTYSTAETPTEPNVSIEKMIEQVKSTGKVTKGGREVSLSKEQSDTATRMLEKLLEMKAINEVAIKDLNMKKGTKEYVKSREKKSTLAIEISQLEKKKLQQDLGSAPSSQPNTGEVQNPQPNVGAVSSPKKNAGAATIDDRIEHKKAQIKKLEQEMRMAGPAVDINGIIKNINKAADGSRKVGKK